MRILSTAIGVISCLFLFSCTSFRPVKVINQKLLGVLPLYEGKITYVDVRNLKGVYAPEYTITVECYPGMYRIAYSSFYLYGTGMEKGKLPSEVRRYPIESGTWATDENETRHFIEIDEPIKRMGASLQNFIVDNTATVK